MLSGLADEHIELAFGLSVTRSLLGTRDLDLPILFVEQRIRQLERRRLLRLGHHVVKRERRTSNQVLLLQIIQLIHVISVVDIDLEVLVLLEVIIYIYRRHEFRI